MFEVFWMLCKQILVNIILIDWEKPKAMQSDNVSDSQPNTVVSAWRRLFIANEFNELQTTRLFHVDFTLVTMVFLLYGCKLQYLATSQPDAGDLDYGASPISSTLRFAITMVIWLSLAALQLGYSHLILHRWFHDAAAQP
eukprot:UN04067